jgi:hypothetical protein
MTLLLCLKEKHWNEGHLFRNSRILISLSEQWKQYMSTTNKTSAIRQDYFVKSHIGPLLIPH